MKTIIAIDPGKSGGIAWRYTTGSIIAIKAPDTDASYVAAIREIQFGAQLEQSQLVAYVERVGGFVGREQPGSAMFKFGFGCGVIEGALRALLIPTIYVRPQAWTKHFSLGTAASCATKTIWKSKLKAEAERRYPHLKVTLSTADALLILSYAVAKER